MSEVARARVQVLLAAFLFSTGGAAIKATTFTSWQIAGFRSGIASAAVFLAIPAARRVNDWRIWVLGAAYATTLIAFVTATKLTSAANAIFLQDTAPLYLLLAGPWLLHERVTRRDLLVLFVMLSGLVLFFLGDQKATATAPDPLRGNIIAVVSAITWAASIFGLRYLETRIRNGEPGMAMVAAGNAVAFLACLPLALPVTEPSLQNWAAVSYLGLIQIALAYVILTRGVKHVPALEMSMLMLIEPILNPLWAGLIHHEWPAPMGIAGGALILGGTAVQLLQRRK